MITSAAPRAVIFTTTKCGISAARFASRQQLISKAKYLSAQSHKPSFTQYLCFSQQRPHTRFSHVTSQNSPSHSTSIRPFSSSPPSPNDSPSSSPLPPPPDHLNEAESNIYQKLAAALTPTKLEVQDISGGCGSMYGIEVQSERFRGLSMLKQQRLVNEILGEEIKGWHGVQLRTSVP